MKNWITKNLLQERLSDERQDVSADTSDDEDSLTEVCDIWSLILHT